tara:strand:+ start:3134 stop:3424 length:291 start_codon:yes stop_codon:yes gene_type:complete
MSNSLSKYSTTELEIIVQRHEKNRTYQKKPSAEQRRIWNKRYYQKKKNNFPLNKECDLPLIANERANRQKFYYYRSNNKLSLLKDRYPSIYEKYVD